MLNDPMFWSIGAAIGSVFIAIKYYIKKGEQQQVDDFIDKVKQAADVICEKKKINFSDESPIPLRKGEHFIVAFPHTQMATYKSNGEFAYAAGVFRYKGLRLGGGQVIRNKDWVFDQSGTLYLTSGRLVFDGGNTNVEVPYNKMLGLDVHGQYGKGLYVNKRTGKDIMFVVEGIEYMADKVAAALLIQRGNVSLKSLAK